MHGTNEHYRTAKNIHNTINEIYQKSTTALRQFQKQHVKKDIISTSLIGQNTLTKLVKKC